MHIEEPLQLDEKAKSSTERVRRYYKRHPEKVKKYLRDTVKDRVARNRDRRKAVKKYGKKKMKNHDVHHPNGPHKGNWRLARKDHGRDKKNESVLVENVNSHLQKFAEYVANELDISSSIKIVITDPNPNVPSLGAFSPESGNIMLVIKGRLIADILRTLAHELVHLKQFEDGRLTDPVKDGATGSDIENEANAVAGILMRNYGKGNRDIYLSENVVGKEDEDDEIVSELEMKSPIVVFPGNFEPFSSHHYVNYLELVKEFGKKNVYIAPTDKKDAGGRHPFSFDHKKKIITKMFGIPDEYVVKMKNPYEPEAFLSDLDEATPIVYAIYEKDLSTVDDEYFLEYTTSENLVSFYENVYIKKVSPLKEKKSLSSKHIRYILGSPNHTDRVKQEMFTKIFGKYDSDIFEMMVNVCTKAENDRELTEKLRNKSKRTKLPYKIKSLAKETLNKSFIEPYSEREISVGVALTYDKDHPARKMAEDMLRDALQQKPSLLISESTVEGMYDEYDRTRPFTQQELDGIANFYFSNENVREFFPELAEVEDELKHKIRGADIQLLTIDELKSLYGSKVKEVIDSKNPKEVIAKLAKEDKTRIVNLLTAIKNEDRLPHPTLIQFNGGRYPLYGDDILSVLAAMGKTIAVKSIFYKQQPNIPDLPPPPKETPEEEVDDLRPKNKELFDRIMQMKITNPLTGNLVKVDTAMDYKKTHPAHQIALSLVRQNMKNYSSRAGVPKQRQ